MDDFDDGDDCAIFVSFALRVKLIRLLGTHLVPTDFTLSMSLARGEDAEDSAVELGIAKIRYWFDNIVSKTIAISYANPTALTMLLDDDGVPRLTNPFILCPDEPRDELMATLFQSKATALANGAFIVIALDIQSDNLDGLAFTISGDHSVFLPPSVEEWLGEKSFFETAWWSRDDATTFDVYVKEAADRAKHPAWAYSLDFLDKSGKAAQKSMEAKVHTFKPIVIDGGLGVKPD